MTKGEVAKATAFIVVLIVVAITSLVVILKEIDVNVNPFGFVNPIKDELKALITNFNYALHLVKESSSMVPGSGKLILFLLMILILAVPIEILVWIRRK